jgi:hypothetical protein
LGHYCRRKPAFGTGCRPDGRDLGADMVADGRGTRHLPSAPLASLLSTSISLRCDSQENLRQALWVRLSQVWPFSSLLPFNFSPAITRGFFFIADQGQPWPCTWQQSTERSRSELEQFTMDAWGAPQRVLPSSHICRLYQSFVLSLQRHPDDRPSRALPLPVHASNLKRGGRRPCSRRIPFNSHSKPLV